jgi:hypothetical protein
LTFNGSGTVTTNAVSISSPTIIDAASATVTLGSALTVTNTLTLTAGTINLNAYDVTCGSFISNTNNVRAVLFGPNFINTSFVQAPNITNFSNTGTGGFKVTVLENFGGEPAVYLGTTSGTLYGVNGANVWITGGTQNTGASIGGASTIKSLNFTGFTGTWYLENQIRLWGSLTLSPTMIIEDTLLNSAIEFRSTASGNTITTAGQSINLVSFVGAGGAWTLQDALNVKTLLTLSAGTLNLNGFNASCQKFNGNGSTARSIAFGTNYINITSIATETVLDITTATAFTPTGVGGFKLTGAAATGITRTVVIGGAGGSVATAPNVFVAAGASGSVVAITNNSWVRDLNFTGFSGTFTPSTNTYNIAGSFTLSTGMLYTINNSTTYNFVATTTGNTIDGFNRQIGNVVFNGAGGGWTLLRDLLCTVSGITLTTGALNLNNFNAACNIWTCTGTNIRSIAFGTSGTVEAHGLGTATVLNFADLTNFTYTGTSNIFVAGNSAGTGTINIGTTGGTEATAMNVRFALSNGRIYTFTTGSVVRNLNFTAYVATFAPPAALTVYGSLTVVSGMTWSTGTGTITFASTSTGQTITTAGKSLYAVTFDGVGGAWTMQDAFTATNTVTFANGTINLASSTTSTVGTFVTSGTTLKYLASSSSGVQATISQSTGIVNATYLSIKDSSATGSAIFNAPTTTNINAGNNTGWIFGVQPAISFVGAGTVWSGADPIVAVPAGVVAGDLLLIIWTVNYPINNYPSGWTVIGAQEIAGYYYTTYPTAGPNQVFLYKFAGVGEVSVSLPYIGSAATQAVMLAYRGVADIDVVGLFNSGSGTSASTLAQAAGFANDYIVSVFSTVTAASTWTAPASTTERVRAEATSALNGLLIVDELQSSAGTTTVRSAGLSSSKRWATGTILLRPSGITGTNLYWAGGSQDWDNSAGYKWATSSGGGAVYGLNPTAADNVYFDANSSGQISIVAAVANNMICTGFTGSLGGYGSLKVYGDFTLISPMYWSFSGTLLFSTSTVGANRVLTNRNITTAGNNLDCTVEFNHVSGKWTLVDNLTVTNTLTLTNGNIVGNSKTINCFAFNSINPTTRSLSTIQAINITGNNATVLAIRSVASGSGFYNFNINLTYAGSSGTRSIYLTGDGSSTILGYINLNVTAGSDILAFPTVGQYSALGVRNLDFTGFSGTLNLTNLTGARTGANLIFSSSMTLINGPSFAYWFMQGFSPSLTSAGKTLAGLYLNHSGTFLLNDDLVLVGQLSNPGGGFNANNRNVTIGSFIGRAQVGNFRMGSGTWTLTGTGQIWRNDTSEIDANQWYSDTSTIVISDTSAASKTFTNYGGHSSLSYNAIRIAGGAGTGSVIFLNQTTGTVSRLGTVTSTRTAAYTITLQSSTTTFVTSWLADGPNSSNRIRLNSSTPGVQATLNQPSGAISVFNMIIQDIAAAGCATFNANTSQDAGNNTGWGFGGAVPPERCAFNFFLVF